MCNYSKCIYFFAIILLILTSVGAWDSDQLEIFDLVEEINQNFYNVLNITQDADSKDIKKAFRALSLVLHPDKNDADDAEVRFRQMVAVYDVLKDPNKRSHYDDVLKNGLPNWRSAVYYYRHVRKMGLAETLLTLFIVVSIGQYLVAWGSYIERKYTAEQMYEAKLKKATRKRGPDVSHQIQELEELLLIPKPSCLNTLPIQIPKFLWFLVTNIGPFTCYIIQNAKESYQRRQEVEESSSEEEEAPQMVPQLRRRKKPGFVPVERDDSELPPRLVHLSASPEDASTVSVPISGGLWTDDDLGELVHLVKKYPGGTTDRWEKIAETMGRTVAEVTYMANKLKDNNYKVPGQEEVAPGVEPPKKQKTRGGKLPLGPTESPDTSKSPSVANWSQLQQKALEVALAKHPKGPTDRWEKIAKCVPEKTKEECMLRYKYLVELVKKQKEKKDDTDEIVETLE